MSTPYELFLALRYLRFHRGRTFLSIITVISVAGVTVGTAALVIALALMAGFVQDVRERIHSGSAHLTVLSVEDDVFEGAATLVSLAEAVPGVAAAAPVLYTPAMLILEGLQSTEYAEIHGIDPDGHARVILDAGEQNPFPLLDQPSGTGRQPILLGAELADRLGVIDGDMVRTVVPEFRLSPWAPQPRSRVFEVVGTYNSEHFQEDSIRAYVGIDAARGLLRAAAGSSWLEIRLDDLRRLEPMKESLQGALSSDWIVVDLIEQNRDLIRALETEKLLLFLAIGLIVIVAALNIVSTLILMVADKIKEIGTLSAMGATPLGIAKVFVLQGVIIGFVGTIAGLLLGTVVSLWLDKYEMIRLDPDVYYLTHLPFAPQPLDVVVVGVAAVLVSLLATIYPAFKAANLDPVEAIRYE